MRMEYDPGARALYVRLATGEVAETAEIEEMVYVDLDADGRPLGVEFVVAEDLLTFLERRGGVFDVAEAVAARETEPVAAASDHQ